MSNESLFSLSCIWDTFCSFVFIYFWSSLLCPTCARGLLILVYCVSTGNNELPFYIRSLMFTTSTTFFSCSFCLKGYSFKDPDLPDRLLHHLFCKLDNSAHSLISFSFLFVKQKQRRWHCPVPTCSWASFNLQKLTNGKTSAKRSWHCSIPYQTPLTPDHTWYLSFFVRHCIFWPLNCTPENCVNLRQKLHRDKTA